MTQHDVSDALESALGPWTLNEAIKLWLLRFPYGFSEIGDVVECSLAEEIDYRQQFVDKPLPKHSSGDFTKRKQLQPLEVGVIVDTFEHNGKKKGNRKITDVVGVTWIAVDSDSGVGGKPIVERLQDLRVAHIYTESCTSRLNGSGVAKWHLFLPLLAPKMVRPRSLDDVALVETAEAAARWWGGIHAHVASQLFALGGLERRSDDVSLDRIVQGVYIPHRPDASPKRFLSFCQQGGRCLDLDAFLMATDFRGDVTPPVVRISDIERPKQAPGRVTDEASPDDGPTPGETPGSLAYRALLALGLVGDYNPRKGGYEVLCPWRDSHASAVAAGTQDRFSDSTMVLMGTSKRGHLSGFHCFHAGCAASAGNGAAVSTSDLLKLARSRGVSSEALPDTRAWSGDLTVVGEVAPAAQQLPPPTLPTPFVLAPTTETKLPVPPAAARLALPERKDRDVVTIDEDNLDGMIEQGIAALTKHPKIYKVATEAGAKLVDLLEVPDAVPYVRACNSATLTPELQKVSKWVNPSTKVMNSAALIGTAPHGKTVTSILHAGNYPGIREIRGVVTAPSFHADGLIAQTPGYNPSTLTFYHPVERVPLISEDPGLETLAAAKTRLTEVLADYPFRPGTHSLAVSVWLAGIFTRLMRHTFRGNIPYFIVSAGDRSSGKGKLIDAAALISDGVFSESVSFSASDDENERVIGMFMQGGAPVVHIDNVRGVLSSTKYEAYSTTPNYSTRAIGSSAKITKAKREGIVDTTVWFSGNGVTTGGDIARRSLRIDIEDTTGSPERRRVREGWEGLTPMVRRTRPQLLEAALTLISGYFAAHRRGYRRHLDAFASFDEWSIVRHVVVWMGLPDPFLAVGKPADDDVDADHGHVVDHLLKLGAGERELLQQDVVKRLIDDASKKGDDRKFLSTYSFFADHGIKFREAPSASQTLGILLKPYLGRTVSMPDGRRWKLVKRSTGAGKALQLIEQKG